MLCLCPTTPGDSLRYKYDKAGHRQLALAMIRQRLGPYGGGGLMRPQVKVCCVQACDTANGRGDEQRADEARQGIGSSEKPKMRCWTERRWEIQVQVSTSRHK